MAGFRGLQGFVAARLAFEPERRPGTPSSGTRTSSPRQGEDPVGAPERRLRSGSRREPQLRSRRCAVIGPQIGLLDLLAQAQRPVQRHERARCPRSVGWERFTTSKDIVACLRDAGLDISEGQGPGARTSRRCRRNSTSRRRGPETPRPPLPHLLLFDRGEPRRNHVDGLENLPGLARTGKGLFRARPATGAPRFKITIAETRHERLLRFMIFQVSQ